MIIIIIVRMLVIFVESIIILVLAMVICVHLFKMILKHWTTTIVRGFPFQILNFLHRGPVTFSTLVYDTNVGDISTLSCYFNQERISVEELNSK